MIRWRWKMLLWVFSLAYTRFAWAYDWLTLRVFGGYWHRWQEAALPEVKGPRVLEIGFGPGHLLRKLAGAGFVVTGIDLAIPMASRLRRRLTKSNTTAKIVVASASGLPFQDNSFDTVVTAFPAPWIWEARSHSEIRRVLRPGGTFVVMDGGHLTGSSLADRIRRFILTAAYGSGSGAPDYLGGPKSPWPGSWQKVSLGASHVHLFVSSK